MLLSNEVIDPITILLMCLPYVTRLTGGFKKTSELIKFDSRVHVKFVYNTVGMSNKKSFCRSLSTNFYRGFKNAKKNMNKMKSITILVTRNIVYGLWIFELYLFGMDVGDKEVTERKFYIFVFTENPLWNCEGYFVSSMRGSYTFHFVYNDLCHHKTH